MEFRCRVATTAGQVMEATYIAESEARLRMELEEKGLYLLSVHGAGSLKLGNLRLGLPTRKRIPTPEFLVFNQELATLLKAGLPLVQSLDILRRRVPNPFFRAALDDIYEKVRAGTALSEAFESQRLFPPVYTASLMAGEKSGSLEQVIRRYVQHIKVLTSVRSKVVSALIYPAVLVALSAVVVGLIVFKVVPEFADFYNQFGHGADLPMSTRVVVWISTNLVGSAGVIFGGLIAIVAGALLLVPAAGAAQAAPCRGTAAAVFRPARAQVRHRAGVAHAGDAALGRHSARQRARHRGARRVGNRSMADKLAASPSRCARAAAWPARWRSATCSRTSRSRWSRSASRPARWPTC